MFPKTMELPVELDEATLRNRAVELTGRMLDYENLESQRKSTNDDYREQLKDIDADIHRLAETVRTGQERADVVVDHRFIKETLQVEIKRVDTGEVVETRPATDDERQAELFGDVAKAADDAVQGGISQAEAEEAAGEAEEDMGLTEPGPEGEEQPPENPDDAEDDPQLS